MCGVVSRLPLFLAAVVALALAGCSVTVTGTPAADPADDRFSDAQGRFTIVPPQRWTVDTSGDFRTAVVFAGFRPASSTIRPTINVIVSRTGVDLRSAIAGARGAVGGQRGYLPDVDEDAVLADGTPAHLLGGYFYDRKSDLLVHDLQLFAVRHGTIVIVTGLTQDQDWDRFEATIDASLRTLTVGG
jgi:hypothetical protein